MESGTSKVFQFALEQIRKMTEKSKRTDRPAQFKFQISYVHVYPENPDYHLTHSHR